MKKILITDYFDSLIPLEPRYINQLYHTNFDNNDHDAINKCQKFAISNLKPNLEEFLQDGNELVIVTNLGHCTMDWFLEHWIGPMLKLFTKYNDQIKVFLQDIGLEANYPSYVNKNNCFYLVEDEYIFQILKRKNEVFNYLDLKNKLLFSMGDSTNDIDMLIKNIQLGGISSIIDYSRECDNPDKNPLFHYACVKSDLKQSMEMYQYYMKYGEETSDIEYDDEYKDLQYQMISEQHRNGEISIEDIRKKTMIYNLFSMCYYDFFIYGPMLNIEEIDQYYNSQLLLNSSFDEFYQNVIRRTYKK